MGRTSQRRRERRNLLKTLKKRMPASEFNEIKKQFREEGKRLRIQDLQESLEAEKEVLMAKEEELRQSLKSEGKSKKEIEKAIESWYDDQKIWSLHSDVEDKLDI